ncbi:hypothetical protein BH23PAT2_BH23PAT2_05590 [soil metagenome]
MRKLSHIFPLTMWVQPAQNLCISTGTKNSHVGITKKTHNVVGISQLFLHALYNCFTRFMDSLKQKSNLLSNVIPIIHRAYKYINYSFIFFLLINYCLGNPVGITQQTRGISI